MARGPRSARKGHTLVCPRAHRGTEGTAGGEQSGEQNDDVDRRAWQAAQSDVEGAAGAQTTSRRSAAERTGARGASRHQGVGPTASWDGTGEHPSGAYESPRRRGDRAAAWGSRGAGRSGRGTNAERQEAERGRVCRPCRATVAGARKGSGWRVFVRQEDASAKAREGARRRVLRVEEIRASAPRGATRGRCVERVRDDPLGDSAEPHGWGTECVRGAGAKTGRQGVADRTARVDREAVGRGRGGCFVGSAAKGGQRSPNKDAVRGRKSQEDGDTAGAGGGTSMACGPDGERARIRVATWAVHRGGVQQRPIEGGEFAHRKDGKADGETPVETSRLETVEDAPERCAKKLARNLKRDAVASNRAAVDAGRPRVTSDTIKRLEDRIRTTWERIPREPDEESVEAVRSPTHGGSAKGRQPVDEEHGTGIAKWLVRRAGLALVDDTRPGPARSRRKAPVCPRESVRLGDANAGHSTPIRARGARRKAGGGGGATQTAPGAAALTERRTGTIGTSSGKGGENAGESAACARGGRTTRVRRAHQAGPSPAPSTRGWSCPDGGSRCASTAGRPARTG